MIDEEGSRAEDNQEDATDAVNANHESMIENDAAKQEIVTNNFGVDSNAVSHIDAHESVNKTIPSPEHAYSCMEREKPEILPSDANNHEVPTSEVCTTDFDSCDQPDNVVRDSSSEDLKKSVSGMEMSAGNGTNARCLIDEMPKDSPVPEDISTVDGSTELVKSETNTVESLVNSKRESLLTEDAKQEFADALTGKEVLPTNQVSAGLLKPELDVHHDFNANHPPKSFLLDTNAVGVDESGTEEEQAEFMKELEVFHKERCLDFKPPRFYGEPLNCLKLWRAVIRLGGYEQVTSCKLWRQVGESFKPPKTCTTVSWTFRCFYEKALLEYEKHKMQGGELPFADASFSVPSTTANQGNQTPVSGRARRDAAARAMQGWHSQRLLGNGEVGDPIVKEKTSTPTPKREKQLKSIGLLKRKKLSPVDDVAKVTPMKIPKTHSDSMITDIGTPADWVKINVQRTNDCFEVYALVPGLLREEVRVQSDPAGCLVISGQPEELDNPWGVTPFKKVVTLPSRIDPHQTSAVVTLHGQLFVRVPFQQPDMN
ncbi:unnamed protein product [Cuscuta epithymum]|uniref:Uncharacterized protein n=1 Tax=Cuscuta epithymum TaxID=186058 RepID=A0AAV0G114_9ASTE|nr:unnamed protein product [Cuscuta epithymum]